jgi:oligosaccharyltransferase complex subunit delta (ribophorin II)
MHQVRSDLPQTRAKIPSALQDRAVQASIVIGSFGSSKPLKTKAFTLQVAVDPNAPAPSPPLRYGKLPEIHHIFRADPSSPPKLLTLVFTAAVLACLPALFIAWGLMGGNLKHLPTALGAAPVSHALFFGSVLAMELVFFMYYSSWRLFTALPAAGAVGLVLFLSGSRALTEVQERRLRGER